MGVYEARRDRPPVQPHQPGASLHHADYLLAGAHSGDLPILNGEGLSPALHWVHRQDSSAQHH